MQFSCDEKDMKEVKEPRSFTLLIQIIDNEVVYELSDLKLSKNLITLLVFNTLSLEKLRLWFVVLQMVDKTRVHPKGITEEVLIKVSKFIIPNDFIFLDYYGGYRVSIILECPFLVMEGELLDVREATLKIRLDDKETVFKVYKPLNQP